MSRPKRGEGAPQLVESPKQISGFPKAYRAAKKASGIGLLRVASAAILLG